MEYTLRHVCPKLQIEDHESSAKESDHAKLPQMVKVKDQETQQVLPRGLPISLKKSPADDDRYKSHFSDLASMLLAST